MVHVHGNSLGLASLSSNIFLCKTIIQFEANIPKEGGEQSYVPVFKPKTWGSRPTNITPSLTLAKPGALGLFKIPIILGPFLTIEYFCLITEINTAPAGSSFQRNYEKGL